MDKLQGLIDQVVEIVKGSKDFAVAQAPDFVRQYLILNVCQDVGWFIFCLFLSYFALMLGLHIKRSWDELSSEGCFFGLFGTGVIATASVLGLLSNIEDIFEIWLAPKAYLVTHLIQLAAKK